MNVYESAAAGALIGAAVFLATSCAPSPEARDLAQTAASVVSELDPELRKLYAAELDLCFGPFRAEAEVCVAETRKRWNEVRRLLGEVRTSWCALEPAKCAEPSP